VPHHDGRPATGPLNRRQFLRLLGAAGGTAAVFSAMDAWGMIAASAAEAPPTLEGRAEGRRVVILCVGLAGMTAAYELSKLPVIHIVLRGRAGMPSFGGVDDDQIALIVSYVRQAWENDAHPVDAEMVATVRDGDELDLTPTGPLDRPGAGD
jgi:hypothetical protein